MRPIQPIDDRSTRARIRDEAILRFGDVGYEKATIREIAAAADVSPGLVTHHFGSKAGLRSECDDYVLARFAQMRNDQLETGNTDPLGAMAAIQQEQPLTHYIMQSFREGSMTAATLFDGLVEESVRLTEASVDEGIVRPSENLRDEVIILVGWQFGALLLEEHMARAFDTDPSDPEYAPRYIRAVLQILTNGVFADSRYLDAWSELKASGEPPPEADTP
jgi:AcrR family transcriptional regulator